MGRQQLRMERLGGRAIRRLQRAFSGRCESVRPSAVKKAKW